MNGRSWAASVVTGIMAVWMLAACVLPRPQASTANTTPFLAPTSILQSAEFTPTPLNILISTEEPAALPTVNTCVNTLTYLEDLSIPDGSWVTPQSTLDKRWRVRNSGTCNWNEKYRLKLIAGTEMGVTTEMALFPARSGSEVVIEIQFIAPSESGEYRSAWQAVDPSGAAFGDPIFIDINVQP